MYAYIEWCIVFNRNQIQPDDRGYSAADTVEHEVVKDEPHTKPGDMNAGVVVESVPKSTVMDVLERINHGSCMVER